MTDFTMCMTHHIDPIFLIVLTHKDALGLDAVFTNREN